MSKIRVAVCDDEITICQYYQNILQNSDNIEFIGKALNVADCIELVKNTLPDVLLLDLQIDYQEAGFKVLREVNNISPHTKVIILTMYDTETNLFNALQMGADYFLGKNVSSDELIKRIERRYNSTEKYDEYLTERLLSYGVNLSHKNNSLMYLITIMSSLTKSEIEVLRELCDGSSYRQIAKKRFVAENTVRSQVVHIARKLNYKNIKELVKLVKELDVFKLYNGD